MSTINLTIGNRYNWKGQPERLIYLGPMRDATGIWYQFCKVGDASQRVWCEVRRSDLTSFEESESEEVLALREALKVAQEENAKLWNEREEPLAKVALYVSECNRLERECEALQADAELGRIAMRFVDRAGDVAGCDPAERICTEFYKAMGDTVEAHCAAARKS